MLRKMTAEDLLKHINTIKNPYLVAAMIELESRGKNKSKRRRDKVVSALKNRLEEVAKTFKNESMMFGYLETTKEGYKVSKKEDTEDDNF